MAAIKQFFSLRKPGSEGHARLADQDQLDATLHQFKPRLGNLAQKAISIFSIILVPLFTFFLPFWSYLLNDVMTPDLYGKYGLCDVNASAVNCGSPYASTKLTYAEMVEEQNLLAHRTDADGNLWACGCEQGWLADWVCPLNLPSEDRPPSQPDYFSISYFIATAPGTGAMAAVSVWGIISYWIMGPGSLSFWQHVVHGSDVVHAEQCDNMSWGFWLSTITLFIFQITFGFFLMNPVCIVPWLHTLVVTTFIVAAVIHFLTIAVIGMYNTGLNTTDSKIIVTMVLIAVIPLLTTVVVPSASWPGNFGLYAFYYAECLGLSVGFNIPSVLFLTTGRL